MINMEKDILMKVINSDITVDKPAELVLQLGKEHNSNEWRI